MPVNVADAWPRLVVGLLALTVALATVSGFATTVGSAQQTDNPETISINRTGPETIGIYIPSSAIGPGDDLSTGEVEVSINQPDIGSIGSFAIESQSRTINQKISIPTSSIAEGHGSLNRSTVVLLQDGKIVYEEPDVPLYRIRFGSLPAWTSGKSLYIPLNDSGTVGLNEEDTVSLQARTGDRIRGDVIAGGATLEVPLSDYLNAINESLTLTAVADGTQVSAGSYPMAPDLRIIDGTPVLWHPRIQPGKSYSINLSTEHGRYLADTSASNPGYLPLPPSIRGAESHDIRVTSDSIVIVNQRLSFEAEEITGTLLDHKNVNFGAPIEKLDVSAIDVNGNHSLSSDTYTVDGRKITLNTASIDSGQTLTLFTKLGVIEVTLQTGEGTDGGNSSAGSSVDQFTIIWILVSMLISGIFGFSSGRIFGFPSLGVLAVVVALLGVVFFYGVFIAPMVSTEPIQPQRLVLLEVLIGMAFLVASAFSTLLAADGTSIRTTTHPLTVTVSHNGTPLTGQTTIEAVPGVAYDLDPQRETIQDGRGRISLPEAEWTIKATHGEYSSSEEVTLRGPSQLKLNIRLPGVNIQVVDDQTGTPLTGADVRMKAGDHTEQKTTDRNGTVQFDPGPEATQVTVSAHRDRFHDKGAEYRLEGSTKDVQDELRLTRRTGDATLVSKVDGIATHDIPIRLEPAEDVTAEFHDDFTVTTGSNGTASTGELLVGRYRAKADTETGLDTQYDSAIVTIQIEEGEMTERTVDLTFTWGLSQSHLDRLRALRTKSRALTDRSGQDTAIPRYYVSVVEEILDTVDSIPEAGHQFAGAEVYPGEVADALLEAAERVIGWIDGAMSTKRNVDLFAACTDLSDPGVSWNGTIDIGDIVEGVQEPTDQRRRVAARVDEVSDRIHRERNDLSEVDPAREMLDRISIDDHETSVQTVAAMVVDLALLDAIEELFERQPLRDRLSRTVF